MPRLFPESSPALEDMDTCMLNLQVEWQVYRAARKRYAVAMLEDRSSHNGADVELMEATTNAVAAARNEYFAEMRDFREEATEFKTQLRKLIGNKYL